eukprot:TRINITY_DN2550_c0_g1_i1.p1 TRINITY_DN2550_c0_g1~~TRINITY_DN2550_c0_g1_i1.p1  ORF type:complete len:222 (-),score=71.21 TRINITY_DN2550_c0_g1_i1:90-755(-)
MEWLFGKRMTPEEIIKEHQRTIKRSIREIERERAKMERSEGKIIADIKKAAKDNQIAAAKIMAKDLVRTRAHVQKMYKMKTQLQAVSLRIQTVKSQATMNNAMKGVTRAMMRMNRSMNLPGLQRIMMEFQKQSEIMNMKEETIEDTMEDMWSDEDEEAATDDVLNQVLDEIGITLGAELGDTPQTRVAQPESAAPERSAVAADSAADADLLNRLNNLRKND